MYTTPPSRGGGAGGARVCVSGAWVLPATAVASRVFKQGADTAALPPARFSPSARAGAVAARARTVGGAHGLDRRDREGAPRTVLRVAGINPSRPATFKIVDESGRGEGPGRRRRGWSAFEQKTMLYKFLAKLLFSRDVRQCQWWAGHAPTKGPLHC